jgi:hypothetical protein
MIACCSLSLRLAWSSKSSRAAGIEAGIDQQPSMTMLPTSPFSLVVVEAGGEDRRMGRASVDAVLVNAAVSAGRRK